MDSMREFKGKLVIVLGIWAILVALFHLYTAYYGSLEPRLQRAVHLLFLLPLVFLVFPKKRLAGNSLPSVVDWILAVLALLPSLYLILAHNELSQRVEQVEELTTLQTVLGSLVVLLVLEACRRAVSGIFALTVVIVLAYIFVAPYLPGILNARYYSFSRVMEIMFLSSDQGVYGFLTGISSNVLFIFILFASIMLRSGVGEFFMDLSVMIAGKYRGGPAKVAVLSSGLYGSVSGSSVADVYSTGSFSIPLMKKIGYPPTVAAAIESVACAGGPLLPPVMGAGAFIMAEMTQSSYAAIAQAAILSAIIYYIGIISTVHFEAVSMNLKPVPQEWNVGWKNVLKRIPFLFPFVVMVYLLMNGISPAKSAVYSMGFMFLLWIIMMRKQFRWTDLVKGLDYAAKSGAVIAAALAGSGILVAVVNQTGIALSVSNFIVEYSFGNLWIALFLVMLVTLVLGAGIPTTPSYVITAAVAGGALSFFHVPILSAHLFVFYFAILADITPPVGVTAFAAAGIAGAPPMKTSILSSRFAYAGFIVPYIFVVNPALLMDSNTSWNAILLTFVVTCLAVIGISSVLVGALFNKIGWFKRIVLLAISLLMLGGSLYLSLLGVLLFFLFVAIEYGLFKRGSTNLKGGEQLKLIHKE
jgi:TRAP transporter 4TM/12TM fusion protein